MHIKQAQLANGSTSSKGSNASQENIFDSTVNGQEAHFVCGLSIQKNSMNKKEPQIDNPYMMVDGIFNSFDYR